MFVPSTILDQHVNKMQFLIGCILSSWFSCSSFHAWFTAGECDTARDHRASVISLYYSYAVDLVTDFASMKCPQVVSIVIVNIGV